MVYPVTAEQAAALLESHQMSVRVECLRGSESLGTIPFSGGDVTATFTSQINREANLVVPVTVTDAGLLNPLTDHIMIFTGIPGIVEVPIFFGRINSAQEDDTGRVRVNCIDQSSDIIKAKFEQPWQAFVGGYIADEMVRMIIDVDGDFSVDISRAPVLPLPAGTWEEDRGSALDEMASSLNCIWQADRIGGFVVYPNPYTIGASVTPVFGLEDGPDGNLVSNVETRSREYISNSVTVIVERTDNSPPIRVTVRDSGATSPTRWGGLFGKQNTVRKFRSPIGPSEAASVAIRILTQSLALSRSWQITTPHFPLFDPGDVISVKWRGNISTQVVESISYPLMAIDNSSLSTRELRLQEEIEVIPEVVTEDAS